MRAGYIWIASLACCPLAAWPLLAHPSYRRFSLSCRIGLAAAAGGVLVSGWMTLLGLAGVSWRPAVLVALAVLTAFLLRFLLPGEAAETPRPAKPAIGLAERLALGITGVALLVALAAAASAAATSPDLVLFWGPKAQAFAATRTFDPRFLGDIFLLYMHPSYPPLVTNLYAFASIVARRFAWGAATLTFPLCLAALALALPGVLRCRAPRRIVWSASALVIGAFGFLGNALDVAGNGEPWLWLYETLATALLVGSAGAAGAGQLLAGLFLAGAVTAKVEGLLFALAALALVLVLRRRELRILPAAAFLVLPGAISLGAWFAFGASRGLFHGYEHYGSLLEVHWDQLDRVLSLLGGALWSAGRALPWLLPLAALFAAPEKSRVALLPLGVGSALALFYVFTYLHVADAQNWISWSAGRIFSPILAFLAVASLCRRDGGG